MSNELQTFRSELAPDSTEAQARARRRLEARIADAGRRSPRARPESRIAGSVLAAALLAFAVVVAADGLTKGSGSAPQLQGVAAPHPIASELNLRTRGPSRARRTDGFLVASPSLDGRDAGTRPTYDRGGWSECATNGCYWES